MNAYRVCGAASDSPTTQLAAAGVGSAAISASRAIVADPETGVRAGLTASAAHGAIRTAPAAIAPARSVAPMARDDRG